MRDSESGMNACLGNKQLSKEFQTLANCEAHLALPEARRNQANSSFIRKGKRIGSRSRQRVEASCGIAISLRE